jgi:hypothetical protein
LHKFESLIDIFAVAAKEGARLMDCVIDQSPLIVELKKGKTLLAKARNVSFPPRRLCIGPALSSRLSQNKKTLYIVTQEKRREINFGLLLVGNKTEE